MNKKITIIDYGIGNVFSVKRAIETAYQYSDVIISSNHDDIMSSDRLVLPGVGAFKDGMDGLYQRDLIEPLLKSVDNKIPLLGICLGMQLFADISEEFGDHNGLSFINGRVESINNHDLDGNRIKVPFIGWSKINLSNNKEAANSCLVGLENRSVYLVHSFHFRSKYEDNEIAHYYYGGNKITAGIKNKNITGLQFHPEKSGTVGLKIIKNFLS